MRNNSLLRNIFLCSATFTLVIANDNNSAMLNGNTGIIETPNARIMPDWSMRFFINQDQPFTYFGFGATPLPFLETNFKITRIDGVAGFTNNSSYGSYKDKSFSLKMLIQKESEYLPSILIGLDDFWGTALYSSKYVALGKKIGFADITLGYAKGRLGGEDISLFSSSSNSGGDDNSGFQFVKDTNWSGGKPFASLVVNAHPKVDFLLEYSPIDYQLDRVNAFYQGTTYDEPESNLNFGLKYNYSKNSIFSLSYTRGNNLAFGYSYQFGFDRTGMFDHLPDPKWKADNEKLKEYKNLTTKQLTAKLSNEVAAEKFEKVTTEVIDNKIWLEFENSRYNNDLKAAGRAISTIDEVAPKSYDTLYATLKEKDVPVKTYKVNRKEFDFYEKNKVSSEYIKDALVITNSVSNMYKEFNPKNKNTSKSEKLNFDKFDYNFGLSANAVLNNAANTFTIKLGAKVDLSYDFGNGLYSKSTLSHPFYNTIKDLPEDGASSILSKNGEMLEYSKYNSTQLNDLTLNYMFKTPFDSISKIETGYLNTAFAGIDIQWYKTFFEDRFGVGLQYQGAYKRHVNNLFKIYDDLLYDAKFINFDTLIYPKYDISLGLKYGKFMAGDKGFKIDLSRNYKNFSMGAFATFTNSDEVFTDPANKGYIDKGIYLKVPLEVFTYKNIKNILKYNLKPWTRDVGRYVETSSLNSLTNGENNIQIMKKYINLFKE